MPLVVLLRGVNVGGHRTFRPAELAKRLSDLDVVNLGAAGTFVVRGRIPQAQAVARFRSLLPFETEIVTCTGKDLLALLARARFVGQPVGRDVVRFVSVLSRSPRSAPPTPIVFPEKGPWMLRILARDRRFVFGVYRRHMKAIGYLGKVDGLFGVPATTRNWNTVTAIAKVLQGEGA